MNIFYKKQKKTTEEQQKFRIFFLNVNFKKIYLCKRYKIEVEKRNFIKRVAIIANLIYNRYS